MLLFSRGISSALEAPSRGKPIPSVLWLVDVDDKPGLPSMAFYFSQLDGLQITAEQD